MLPLHRFERVRVIFLKVKVQYWLRTQGLDNILYQSQGVGDGARISQGVEMEHASTIHQQLWSLPEFLVQNKELSAWSWGFPELSQRKGCQRFSRPGIAGVPAKSGERCTRPDRLDLS